MMLTTLSSNRGSPGSGCQPVGSKRIGIEKQPLVIDPPLGETEILAESETNPAILAITGRIEPHFCLGIGPVFIIADEHLLAFGHGYDRTGNQVPERQNRQRQNDNEDFVKWLEIIAVNFTFALFIFTPDRAMQHFF